ncbi:hypothetical protein DSCOOX_24770 [Desulfosarcina ovata subsp. ovata]|uniref:Uncharacterized protein n=1 Tax=Desulfosarcina ovata subsp. ovata TaxID=2752305 RepID=A0A5K8A9R0_9BACT|nr:hypothetical protein DSCOOX_24770 [Desulfosarcina ovata subsp. ovata]
MAFDKYLKKFSCLNGLVAPYSNFKEVHVYSKEAKDVGLLEKRLNLKPVSQGANLGIMRPYYSNSVFYNFLPGTSI